VSNDSGRWYVDSLANMSFTGNVNLVLNVEDVDVKVDTMGGMVKVEKRGYLPIVGEVYIGESCKVNGIGLCILIEACGNDWYINGDQWIFNIRRGNKCIKLVFTLDSMGYGCTIDNNLIKKLQELEGHNKGAFSSNKLPRLSNDVADNEKLYSKKQLVRAKEAIEYWGALGSISEGWFKKLLRNGTVNNIPFDVQDVNNAIMIYGRPTYQTKGTLKYKKTHIVNTKVEFRNETQVIFSDVMTWCTKPYLISIAAPMYLITVYNLPRKYTQDDILACWSLCINLFTTYDIHIDKIVCDGDSKFVAIKDAWCVGVPIENVGSYQHNSKIEVEIRIIKERMRCLMARVSWKVPGALIDSLTIAAASIINVLPRVNETVGARQKLTGKNIDYNQMKYSWGQYGQGYVRSAQINNDNFRSQGVIILYPKFNESGSYLSLNLNTKKFVIVSQFVASPTPDDVIEYMNTWYYEDVIEKDMRLNKSNMKLLNKDSTDERRVRKKVERKIDNNIIVHNGPLLGEDVRVDTHLNPHDEEHEPSNVEEREHRETIIIEDGGHMSEELKMNNEVVDTEPGTSDTDGDIIEFEGPMNTDILSRRAQPERRRKVPSKYMYLVYEEREHGGMHLENESEDIMFCLMSRVKSALSEGGRDVEDAISKEFKQLIEKDVWEYVNVNDHEGFNQYKHLSPRPISSLLNVDKKVDGHGVFVKWKARFCACGNHQDRDLYDEEDLSSPTMTLESIFILIAFAAQWNASIVTADIAGAYLESSLEVNDIVYMYLSKDSVDELKKIDPRIVRYIMSDGRALVRLLKALYGTIQAAKLWYKKLKEIIIAYGFSQHPHDQCVFIIVMKGIVMIIGFHVDDLLMICKNKKMIDDFIAYLLTCFTNVTVHEGNQQTYLGMLITKELDGAISVSMEGYIEKVLKVYELSVDTSVKDPQQDNIFKIDDKSTLLSESRRRVFHKVVYMLVYLGKRVRFDVQMTMSFLAGRVTKATEEDENKLFRVLRFLRNSITEKIFFHNTNHVDDEGKSSMDVRVWADSSWGCHEDGTSRSAVLICVNGTCVASYTHKQKMITLHATEAELVCLTDAARLGTWTRMFVEHIVQSANSNDEVLIMTLMQDNESVIKIQNAGQRNKQRTRHLTIRLWWTQELVEDGIAKIEWVSTKGMLADFLTKALHGVSFKYCWNLASGNIVDKPI